MFFEIIIDIFYTIKQQKLRTLLTGFGIGWGIFVLILLLGASGGFEKGVLQLLNGFAQNSIWVYGGESQADMGDNKYTKNVSFSSETIIKLSHNFSDIIAYVSPESQSSKNISYKDKNLTVQTKRVAPNYFHIKTLQTQNGRLINQSDYTNNSKVVVIGKRVKERLFKNEIALNKEIKIGKTYLKVIGILSSGSVFNQAEQNVIFTPLSTAMQSLGFPKEFNTIGLTLKSNKKTDQAEKYIKSYLARQLNIDVNDNNALYVFNFNQQVGTFQKVFKGLNVFFWFIGICLLLSGIVGVTNIMFVIVNERTSEIGIRKAIGATNQHILWMILLESAVITLFAGIIGVVLDDAVLMLISTPTLTNSQPKITPLVAF